jgi:8-oxo-dGTP diphosphatase
VPPDPNVHVGVAALVHRDDHLLMIRREGQGAFAEDGRGTWAVPGGWMHLGETAWQAAVRETREETGVVVSARQSESYVCNDTGDHTHTIVTLFVNCEWVSGEPHVTEPDRCPEVGWIPFARVLTLPLFLPVELWIHMYGVQKMQNKLVH